jgi:hypothetical protein
MNLLDKYMAEVGKHLPRKNRLDLQTEIRSTIEDMLEDRSQQSGKLVDDALISGILLEYGAPAKVAAAYKPTRFLIGPRLYPFFEMVIKIVLSVLTVIALIGFGINIISSGAAGPAFITALGKYGLQYMTGVISAFGNIVLVFAILERVLPASEFEEETEKWVPADLNAGYDPDEIKRGELIFGILFTMLGLALLNLYPNLIGFAMVKDSTWVFIPALSEAFFRYLPLINLLGVLQILLDLYLLRKSVWHTASRLFNLAVETAGIALACVMLVGPSLVSLDPGKMARALGESAGVVLKLFNILPLMVLVILIGVQSIEVTQAVWRMLKQRNVGKTFFAK